MINYLKKVEGVSTPLATRFEPLFKVGERERAFAGENPDVYVSGVWYNSTNGVELMSGGNFDTQADVDLWTAGSAWNGGVASVSFDNNTMKVQNNTTHNGAVERAFSTTIGKKYKVIASISGNDSWLIRVGITSFGAELVNSAEATEVEFIASTTTTYIQFAVENATNGNYINVDNVTLFETEIEPDTPYVTPQTYLPIKADINAEGEITNLIAWDTPSLVEDYIVADKVKAELLGKNACTAWVSFDGTTTPPTIRDSYNVSKVLRTGDGVHKLLVNMDNINFSPLGTVEANAKIGCKVVSNTEVEVLTYNSAGAPSSRNYIYVHIFGGKE